MRLPSRSLVTVDGVHQLHGTACVLTDSCLLHTAHAWQMNPNYRLRAGFFHTRMICVTLPSPPVSLVKHQLRVLRVPSNVG